jgi:hypothetical protein
MSSAEIASTTPVAFRLMLISRWSDPRMPVTTIACAWLFWSDAVAGAAGVGVAA